jgi:hypothetical protein
MGALYLQRLRFQILPSAKAGKQPLAANLRPMTTQQVSRTKATQDGDATRGQTPNPKGGLHARLRSARRDLRDGHQPSGPRLLHHNRTRTCLHTRGATYGLHVPRLLLQNNDDFRKLPSRPGLRTPYRTTKKLHEDPPQTNALAKRKDSTLRRRLFAVLIDIRGGSLLTPTPL